MIGDAATTSLPLFPLNTVLFPGMLLPLHLFEERYLRLLRERATSDPVFGVVKTRHGREVDDQPVVHDVGTAARLLVLNRLADESCDIVVVGADRFSVLDRDWSRGYLSATIRWMPDHVVSHDVERPAVDAALAAFERFLVAVEQATDQAIQRRDIGHDPLTVGYAIAGSLPVDARLLQRLLEAPTPGDRLKGLIGIIHHERRLLERTQAGGATLRHPGSRFQPN